MLMQKRTLIGTQGGDVEPEPEPEPQETRSVLRACFYGIISSGPGSVWSSTLGSTTLGVKGISWPADEKTREFAMRGLWAAWCR